MAKNKALAKRRANLLMAGGYAADAGAGFEQTQVSDFSITRLAWLQDLSPQVKKGANYIEGAKPGMILDPVTSRLYTQLTVVPFHYRRVYVEWIDRDDDGKGGFVGEHAQVDSRWEREIRGPYRLGKKHTVDRRDHIINDTREFGVLFSEEVENGFPVNAMPALLALTASQIKRAANWLTVMSGKIFTAENQRVMYPLFANIFTIELEDQTNRDGKVFFGWKIVDTGKLVPPDHELYQRGSMLHQQMLAGTLTAPAPQRDVEPEDDRL